MRYPPVADVHSLVLLALHIKSPKVSITNCEFVLRVALSIFFTPPLNVVGVKKVSKIIMYRKIRRTCYSCIDSLVYDQQKKDGIGVPAMQCLWYKDSFLEVRATTDTELGKFRESDCDGCCTSKL